MFTVSKKVTERINSSLKVFQKILETQKSRDISEADTVTLVKDILGDTLGFDKYIELTGEYQIKGTFCDLAVKIDGKVKFLIEVKAIGTDLKTNHIQQALNYGVNQGIEWIVLTNSIDWRLYKIKFGQPVESEEITSFNLLTINTKNDDDLKKIFLLCREGLSLNAMDVFHQHAQTMNKFTISIIIQSEPILTSIRKEIRKIFPGLKVENDDIQKVLLNDILKRDVMEGDKFEENKTRVKKALNKLAKSNIAKNSDKVITETKQEPDTQ